MVGGKIDDGFYMDDEPLVDASNLDPDWQWADLKAVIDDILTRLEKLENQDTRLMPFQYTPNK
jgi:hypothetical protein